MLAIAYAMTMNSILRLILEHLKECECRALLSLQSSSTFDHSSCKLAQVTAGLVLQRASYLTCETRLISHIAL